MTSQPKLCTGAGARGRMSTVTYRAGVILVCVAGLCWSAMGLTVRLIGDAGTWQILFYRSLGMAPVLLAYITWRTRGHPLRAVRGLGLAGIFGGLSLVFAFAGGIYAFQTTTIANAAFLFAAAPLITAALGWIVLREPVRHATWIAIAIALLGIVLMVRSGLSSGAFLGNLAALASAFGFAGFTISLRWGRLSNMLPAVMLGGIMSVLVAGSVVWASGEAFAVAPRDAALAMGMGVILLGGGMVAYTIGSRTLSAVDLSLLSMVEVVFAPIWVWLVLAEVPGPGSLLGGAVLMSALVFNALSGIRHRPAKVI